METGGIRIAFIGGGNMSSALLGGLLAWRGRRRAGLAAALACTGVLLLSTPALAGLLRWSLEREVAAPAASAPPGAIIVLEHARGAIIRAGGVPALAVERDTTRRYGDTEITVLWTVKGGT
jgi:hypothetical protein